LDVNGMNMRNGDVRNAFPWNECRVENDGSSTPLNAWE
jgi:hypothetical protein